MAKTLGQFELLLLLAVLRLGSQAYGVAIRRELEQRGGRVVSAGAVYTALDRLERRGLIASWLGEPTAERGGRAKRYYRVLPAGEEAVARTQALLRGLAEDLGPRFELP